ncbi:MAG: glycosyl hydrolase family 28 protein, partial [Candidatus Aminicenantes bacterium]|nr:glycosyl hydrolase family 28 protein [Candidatus Aminicenantes bacterium]
LSGLVLWSVVAPAGKPAVPAAGQSVIRVFDIREFGASGLKAENARPAIQKAVDACAAAGGGTVYVPPGEYSSGTIHLRSHVRLFLDAGATVYSIKDKSAFDKEALLYGEDLVDIAIEGRGVFEGQAGYDWRPTGDFRDDFIRSNQVEMEKLGKPLLRSFPKTDQFGKMVLLLRCRDVRITGVSFLNSPSWTIHPVACDRLVIDGVYIYSSLKEAVWADGIDPDGCRDVRIANSTIETGDDALVFYSMDWFGPARPCENITVTNCRLSSASSALKFCDGNIAGIRNVTVSNCVITGSNRGVAFMTFDGGPVENVVLSDLVIDCERHDWFWWGDGEPFHFNIKRRSEVHAGWPKDKDRPAGAIRNVKIQNVIARGSGASVCNGHPDSWLDGVSFENVKLTVAHDPRFPYDKAVHALTFKQARNLRLRDVEVVWEKPAFDGWRSALRFEDVEGLTLERFRGGQAPGTKASAAVMFDRVAEATVRSCRFESPTGTGVAIDGLGTRDILFIGNDFRAAQRAYVLGPGVDPAAVRTTNNVTRRP